MDCILCCCWAHSVGEHWQCVTYFIFTNTVRRMGNLMFLWPLYTKPYNSLQLPLVFFVHISYVDYTEMSWGNHLVKQPENGVSLTTKSCEHELSPILCVSSVITLNHCKLALPWKQLFLSCLAPSCPTPAFHSNISTAAWQSKEGIWARFKLSWWKPTTVSYGGPKALRKALFHLGTKSYRMFPSTL